MPKTLLLADDSVVIQKLVGLSFANEDVELTTTDNGDDAIAKARELKPDLVLADVVMPGKNGYEVCETIKADPELRHIPVLLLTGTFEAFDENRARSAGSDGHITKPFEAQALVDRVTDLLARAPAEPPLATTTPNLDGPAVTRIAAVPPPGTDESFDFFDDGATDLSDAGSEVAAPPPLPHTPSPLAQSAPAAPPRAPAHDQPSSNALPPLAARRGHEDALMPDTPPVSTPPIDDLAFDADDLTPPLDAGATTVQLSDEPHAAGGEADDDLLLGDASDWNDDLEISPEPLRGPAYDQTQLSDELFQDPPARATAPVDLDAAIAAEPPARPSGPTVVSGGERSSDSIAFGAARAGGAPDPMQTMLADDLFGDAPPEPPLTSGETTDLDLEPSAEPSRPSQAAADDFEVSSSDLEHSIPAMPPLRDDAKADDPLASFSPVAPSAAKSPQARVERPRPVEPVVSTPPTRGANLEQDADDAEDFSVSEGLLAGAPPSAAAAAAPRAAAPAAVASPAPTRTDLGPDLTPMMRERVHETLERVAWEAFADLSDTIVKQVVEKVEQVAWEVIPQMAEAAIKEEIRRMKGETDE